MTTITLQLGMTKAEVRELLGRPDCWSIPTRNYPEPMIWKYGNLELTFFTQRKRRVPYPGPVLIRVKETNEQERVHD